MKTRYVVTKGEEYREFFVDDKYSHVLKMCDEPNLKFSTIDQVYKYVYSKIPNMDKSVGKIQRNDLDTTDRMIYDEIYNQQSILYTILCSKYL